MLLETGRFVAARPSLWNRTRLQLGGGLLLAVLIPWLVRIQLSSGADLVGLGAAVAGTFAALVIGYYSFRKFTRYPGVRASYHILPLFSASYGAVLALFFFARLDYSRLQFAVSFAICVIWYYVVYFKLQRQHRLRIAVVPFGDVQGLRDIPGINWIYLDENQPLAGDFDSIVADLRADIPARWERFLADRALEGMLVMHHKQMQESLTGRVAIEHLSENNFGSLIPGIIYGRVKRVIDFIVTILLLPVLVPLLALIGLAVKLDSKGPVFFTQQRMGYRGETFKMFKFRSMVHGHADKADDARASAMTRDDDHRVTRIGRTLRRLRLDELPQVINILKGEMSWIGPRPEAVPLSMWYEAELPFYRYRHIVRPGITGWAQVKQGHVAEVDDVLWKLHYDFYYIKNFSVWLDLLIVAATVKTVASGFGAR
jgi:lipopolysaccharide/colanic/teichoic acid biosynthesis glycosyltransferase